MGTRFRSRLTVLCATTGMVWLRGVKAAVVIGALLATFVIGGIVTTNRTQHSDSWYQGYENAETAKIMYNVGGISKREACRASLTAPPSLDHDDLIDGCIAALGG